ncbi:MAG: hypothetical protein WA634_18770 [Silvibacterium sp.]
MKIVSDAKASEEIRQLLIGLHLTEVVKVEFSWHFVFNSGNASLNVECPWRIIANGRIAHGCDDHDQMFGLPAPVDGIGRSMQILSASPVISVILGAETGDLRIEFEDRRYLEFFNSSSGYEGWSLRSRSNPSFCLVAMGGGKLAIAQ